MTMNSAFEQMSMEEFVNSPWTEPFILRLTSKSVQYIKNRPDARITNVLRGGFAVGYIVRESFEDILTDAGYKTIDAYPLALGLLGQEDLYSAGIIQAQQQPYLNLRGQGTLVAIIDTGIDYTQPAFQYEDGTTKIKYIWDQALGTSPPKGYYYGTEFGEQQINEALSNADPYSVVPHRDTVGHGTFLASVAASHDKGEYIGAAPDADLIVVKLKECDAFYRQTYLIPQDAPNVYESSDLMVALDYVLNKAEELNMPVAICISQGTNMGGHNGLNSLCEYMQELSLQRRAALCVAAGNESQARHHFLGSISENGREDVDILVPENTQGVYLQIWNTISDRLSVGVRSPGGEIISRIPPRSNSISENHLVLENSTVSIEYEFPLTGSGDQVTIIKIINPTPGNWVINVYGDIVLDGTYHIWLPTSSMGNPGIEFLSPSPDYTIELPATAIGPVVCGAYSSADNSLYADSSWGPTRLPRMSPDLVAPGVQVKGLFPIGPGTMSGTSVAAAITAGAGALMLEWASVKGNDIAVNTYLVRAYLIRGCIKDPNIEYPNTHWGYGRLNLINTFNQLRETIVSPQLI